MGKRLKLMHKFQKILLFFGLMVGVNLFLMSCLLTGIGLPKTISLATFRRSGWIAYLGIDGNIYTIDREGNHKTAITSDADMPLGQEDQWRYYQYLAWAPDGKRFAYVGFDQDTGSPPKAILYTVNPDGSELVEAFRSEFQFPFYLYWSPDSKNLSFLTTSGVSNDLLLQVIPARESGARVLGSGQPFYWVWSPEADLILTHTGGASAFSAQAQMALIDFFGEKDEEVLELKPTDFRAPAWSPDGTHLLIAVENEEGVQSLVLADRGGNDENILAEFIGSIAFEWSPDGRRVAYVSGGSGFQPGSVAGLTIVDLDNPDQSGFVNADVVTFFWSPDSRKIAYVIPELNSSPDVVNWNLQNNQGITLSLYVYDLASKKSKRISIFNPTNEFINIVPFFDQYQRSMTIWSPDSQNIVISAYDREGNAGIYVLDAVGEEKPLFLDGGLSAVWSWR
jgi:Tol biopolymer transport system component